LKRQDREKDEKREKREQRFTIYRIGRGARMLGKGSDLQFAAVYFSLEMLNSDDLMRIAVEALVAGYDSPTLRILAGENERAGFAELYPLFKRSLKELQIDIPSEDEAMRQLARYYAEQVTEGEVTPYDGAANLYWMYSKFKRISWLSPFIVPVIAYEHWMEPPMNKPSAQEQAQIEQKLRHLEEEMHVEVQKLLDFLNSEKHDS
jgi:hypothetical protein